MKKRWLQNTLAIVLTAAMCLGLAPCGGPGRIFQAAETKPAAESWTDTNLFTNGDLTEATDEWKAEITDPSGDETKFTINKEQLNANNGSGKINSMSAERTVENVPAGTYRLVFEQNGEETDASVFTLFVKNGETVLTQKELEPTVGWNDGNFSAVETEAFTLEKQSNLTITLSASACPVDYWVNFDNFKLQKSVPSTEIGGGKRTGKIRVYGKH